MKAVLGLEDGTFVKEKVLESKVSYRVNLFFTTQYTGYEEA